MQLENAFAAQQKQLEQLSGQGASLPTKSGIQTAWHAGSLPDMQQGGGESSGVAEPAAKRQRGDESYLPEQQAVGGMDQQQFAMAQTASGVGALSNRLGFTVPQQNTYDMMAQQQQQQQGAVDLPGDGFLQAQ